MRCSAGKTCLSFSSLFGVVIVAVRHIHRRRVIVLIIAIRSESYIVRRTDLKPVVLFAKITNMAAFSLSLYDDLSLLQTYVHNMCMCMTCRCRLVIQHFFLTYSLVCGFLAICLILYYNYSTDTGNLYSLYR